MIGLKSIEFIPLSLIDKSWIKYVDKMIKFGDNYHVFDDI